MNGFARRGATSGWCRPVLDDEPGMTIEDGRHPVVESLLDDPFVANPLHLDDARRMLLVTGPNMGGKSTFMRQCALIALLAHTGCHVPAAAARIGPIDRIFTRIGAADDLARGQSTFMVEMTESALILRNATAEEPGADGRGGARHEHLGRACTGLGVRRAPGEGQPCTVPVRHPLLRADPDGRAVRERGQRAPRRRRARRPDRVHARDQARRDEPQLRAAGGRARRPAARGARQRSRATGGARARRAHAHR